MTRPQAVPTLQISNEQVIVTEWRFAPGAETGWHRHAHDYVVVPIIGGRLLLETADGPMHAELVPGRSYNRQIGVEHNVVNDSPHEIAFVEIELRARP